MQRRVTPEQCQCLSRLYVALHAEGAHPFIDAIMQQPVLAPQVMQALLQHVIARQALPQGVNLWSPEGQQQTGVFMLVRNAAGQSTSPCTRMPYVVHASWSCATQCSIHCTAYVGYSAYLHYRCNCRQGVLHAVDHVTYLRRRLVLLYSASRRSIDSELVP